MPRRAPKYGQHLPGALRTQHRSDTGRQQPAEKDQSQPTEHADQQRQAGHAPGSCLILLPQRLGHIGLCADCQKIEDPKNAGQGRRAHAQRRQRLRPQPRDKGRIHQPGQRLGDEREKDRHSQGQQRAIRPFYKRMFSDGPVGVHSCLLTCWREV